MTTVTVFRRVPPPIIGVCGAVLDRAFEFLEESLDWLETTGVLVDRFDPDAQPGEAARFQCVTDALAREGPRCLPLILVDGDIVSSGVHPTRTQLARVVGQNRTQTELAAAR
jgi:hypothetical protein